MVNSEWSKPVFDSPFTIHHLPFTIHQLQHLTQENFMPNEMVEFKSNGSTAAGYLAVPERGSGAGLVVIQEWWGLVPHIKNVCERFAAEGFVALAPDLYHGRTARSPDEAGKLMMALNIERAEKDL